MSNIDKRATELLIENGVLVADTLRHLADNEIDSDYFAICHTNENGTEIECELAITDYARQAAGTVDELVKALASLEAEAVHQVFDESGGWFDIEKGDVVLEGDDGNQIRTLYTAPSAPVSDSLLSELLAIAKKAADEADECAHAEWNDDSMEHSTAIADWERRAAMPQGAEPVTTAYKLPEGYVLVPVEPTAEMQSAAAGAIRFDTTPINKLWTGNAVYKVMLAAAPRQEVK